MEESSPSDLGRIEDNKGNKILLNLKSSELQKQVNICERSKSIMRAETQLALNKYLEEAKKSLSKDLNSGKWLDSVDYSLLNSDKTVKDETVPNDISRDSYYGRVPHHHMPPVKIIMKDPIYVNPNSFESIIHIFRKMLEKNKCRKWIIIYSDGVPFLLGKFIFCCHKSKIYIQLIYLILYRNNICLKQINLQGKR